MDTDTEKPHGEGGGDRKAMAASPALPQAARHLSISITTKISAIIISA